jgi:hypothetical protein
MVDANTNACHYQKPNPYDEVFSGGVKMVKAKYTAAIFNYILSKQYSRTGARLLFAKMALGKVEFEKVKIAAGFSSKTRNARLEPFLQRTVDAIQVLSTQAAVKRPDRPVVLPKAMLTLLGQGVRRESILVALWGCAFMQWSNKFTWTICQPPLARKWGIKQSGIARGVGELLEKGAMIKVFTPMDDMKKWGARYCWKCCEKRLGLVIYRKDWRENNPVGSNGWKGWLRREERRQDRLAKEEGAEKELLTKVPIP